MEKQSRAKQFRSKILEFFKQKRKMKDKVFTSPELIQFVQKEMNTQWFYPDSLLRELRDLRQENKLNYDCYSKKDMTYKILSVSK